MLILAKAQEIVGADSPGQIQPLRAQTDPLTGDALTFIVVVANRQVFFKVFLCVLEIVLRLRRDHTSDTTRTVRAFCVAITSSPPRLVVNYGHEYERDSEVG